MFFRDRKLTIFGSLGHEKPRIRECVKFGDRGSVKRWSHEHAEAQNLELAIARTSEDGWFGNLSGTQFGTHARRHSRTNGEAKAEIGNLSGDPVRESHVKPFTNQRRGKVKVVVPKSPGFECELVADL
jgi:hypothetical protein